MKEALAPVSPKAPLYRGPRPAPYVEEAEQLALLWGLHPTGGTEQLSQNAVLRVFRTPQVARGLVPIQEEREGHE